MKKNTRVANKEIANCMLHLKYPLISCQASRLILINAKERRIGCLKFKKKCNEREFLRWF